MSNIDKHAVQAVADLKAGYTLGHADVAILNELARIALASLEAEPVAEVCEGFTLRYIGHGPAPKSEVRIGDRLYTASPAPVSVPDERAVELLATDLMKRIDKITGERHSVATLSSLRVSIVEACRAAMLQGAERVTTAYKFPQPIKDNRLNSGAEADDYYSGYQAGWNELLEAVSGNSPVIPDGWVLVPKEPTLEMINSAMRDNETGEVAEIYELMIEAAPQPPGQ